MNFKTVYLLLENLFQTLIMSMRTRLLLRRGHFRVLLAWRKVTSARRVTRCCTTGNLPLEVAPGQRKTHVNSYRRQTVHRGKVDPGVSELPRGNELSRDHVNRLLDSDDIGRHLSLSKILPFDKGCCPYTSTFPEDKYEKYSGNCFKMSTNATLSFVFDI